MSLMIPGSEGSTSLNTGSARTSRIVVLIIGLTSVSPDTLEPCCSASRRASAPPTDKPARKHLVALGSQRREGVVRAVVPVRPCRLVELRQLVP